MSNSTILITIGCAILVGILAIIIHRLKFKKSIVFKITAIMVFPIVFASVIGLIVGTKGIHHLSWGAPLVVIFASVCYEIIAKLLQRPLKEMTDTIESLSQGNVEVVFNEKFQKGSHELAIVMRMLSKMANSLKNIANFAEHVGRGKLDMEFSQMSENDNLGKAMLDMRANLLIAEEEKEKRRQEDERRNWVTQGVAKFADLLRANNNNIEELCYSIVSNLVRYVAANQAGMFILNDDDKDNPVLDLKACYAYDRRKFINKTIGIDEGVVGACFRERESIYMTAIPKDYIRISSGLGDETPRALLIVPLKVNDEIFGIIEIAAFKEFEPHVREFVEKLSESIASTISSVRVNMRTSQLLEQSRLQAEEMANQEEELRQNMEEMQATQEDMYRKENEMKASFEKMKEVNAAREEDEHQINQFHNAVFQTYSIIEFSTNSTVIDVSEEFIQIFNFENKEAIMGKHLSVVVGEETFNKAWDKIMQGKIYENVQSVNTNDKTLSVRQKFVPISSKNGELLKVMMLAVIEN